MIREDKDKIVESLREIFQESTSVLLLNFSGFSVPEETELRRQISELGSQYRVIKNRLALLAAQDTPLSDLREHFQGPTAVAYTAGDPLALAKLLKGFMDDHPGMVFKAGVVEGRIVSSAEVLSLAEMPSRIELLSKLVFLLNSPLTRLVTTLQTPITQLASVLRQHGESQ